MRWITCQARWLCWSLVSSAGSSWRCRWGGRGGRWRRRRARQSGGGRRPPRWPTQTQVGSLSGWPRIVIVKLSVKVWQTCKKSHPEVLSLARRSWFARRRTTPSGCSAGLRRRSSACRLTGVQIMLDSWLLPPICLHLWVESSLPQDFLKGVTVRETVLWPGQSAGGTASWMVKYQKSRCHCQWSNIRRWHCQLLTGEDWQFNYIQSVFKSACIPANVFFLVPDLKIEWRKSRWTLV